MCISSLFVSYTYYKLVFGVVIELKIRKQILRWLLCAVIMCGYYVRFHYASFKHNCVLLFVVCFYL